MLLLESFRDHVPKEVLRTYPRHSWNPYIIYLTKDKHIFMWGLSSRTSISTFSWGIENKCLHQQHVM